MAADEGDEAGLFPKAEEAQSHGQPGQQPLPLMSPWGAGGGVEDLPGPQAVGAFSSASSRADSLGKAAPPPARP